MKAVGRWQWNGRTPAEGDYQYSGLGSGYYFSNDGKVYWVSPKEAADMARDESLSMNYIEP